MIGFFALCHGYAHGVELPLSDDPADYAVGFVLATGMIHVIGVGVGLALLKPFNGIFARLLGPPLLSQASIISPRVLMSETAPLGRSFWSGLALGLLGTAVLVVTVRTTTSDTLRFWLVHEGVRPLRLLPLIGFGVGLGLASWRLRAFGACAILIGAAFGFAAHRTLLASLWAIPNIASQQFLVGPMSAIAAGLVLIDHRRVAPLTVPLCGFVLGAAAIGIIITDPSLAGWTVRLAGCAAAIWTVTWAAISAAGLRGGWPRTAGAVLGSWLTGSSR